jgi:hypothetical protein
VEAVQANPQREQVALQAKATAVLATGGLAVALVLREVLGALVLKIQLQARRSFTQVVAVDHLVQIQFKVEVGAATPHQDQILQQTVYQIQAVEAEVAGLTAQAREAAPASSS